MLSLRHPPIVILLLLLHTPGLLTAQRIVPGGSVRDIGSVDLEASPEIQKPPALATDEVNHYAPKDSTAPARPDVSDKPLNNDDRKALTEDTAQSRSIAQRFAQLPRFGRRVFHKYADLAATTPTGQEAIDTPPTPPGYLIGTGDILSVRCWHDTREHVSQDVTVNNNGAVYLPFLGDIIVAGRTLSEATKLITGEYRRIYRQARVAVTLTRLRSVEIYVTGEVEWPGRYTLPGSATVFTLLYVAGGPSEIGSLRRVQILKHTSGVRRSIDLYDYLLGERYLSNINIETGDTLFVPAVRAEVAITGEVLRPARYELLAHETLSDLLRMAGGLNPTADAAVVQIWRNTPQGPQLLSANISETGQSPSTIYLSGGDLVEVLQSPQAPVNTVEVSGAVKRAGVYACEDGDRISDLLKEAGGLSQTAHTNRGKLLRQDDQLHYQVSYFQVDRAIAKDEEEDLVVQPHDKIIIYSQSEVEAPAQVVIRGPVVRPGCYEWASGMKVSDLLLQAGGLLPEAYGLQARALRRGATNRQYIVPVALSDAMQEDSESDITLHQGDILEIFVADAVTAPSQVRISGFVNNPGTYRRYEEMCVSDLILAAGGVAPGAGPSLQCVSGHTEGEVRTTQLRLQTQPDSTHFSVVPDLLLHDDDHIAVQGSGQFVRHPPVVIVEGEVKNPGAYPIPRRDASLWALLQKTEGLLETANPRGIIVYRSRDKFFPVSQEYSASAQIQQVLRTFNRERREQILEKDKRTGVVETRISRALTNIFSVEGGATVVIPPRLLNESIWAEAIPIDGKLLVESHGREGDIALMDGDCIVVPRPSHTVGVVGAVVRSGAIPYEGPHSPLKYVELSGGVAEDANLARMVVIRANTRVVPADTVSEVYPGDVIVIPSDFVIRTVQSGTGYERLLRSLAGLVTALLIF